MRLSKINAKALENKFGQLGNREKVILTLAIIASMLFLFSSYGFRPNLKIISEIKNEIEMKSQDVEIAKAEGIGLTELKQEYKRLTEKINNFETKIPKETKVDIFVNDLTKIAGDHGVTIKSIKVGDTGKEGEYTKFSIEISLLSQPEKLISFLDALSTIPRLVGVKEFEVNADDYLLPDVSVRLLVATYSI